MAPDLHDVWWSRGKAVAAKPRVIAPVLNMGQRALLVNDDLAFT